MSFDYDKHKNGDGGGHEWGSYSDLFMCLSVVFLFLYVIASLRTGTANVQSQAEYQKLAQEAADLKQQIKVYNTLKKDYLETGATDDEQKSYAELMDKLKLLKEEAANEKESLRQQASENEKKEMALNKYQQMIRNIINSNMIAQARIKRRDDTIVEKTEEITEKTAEIEELEQTVEDKKKAIEQGERKIAQASAELDRKVRELKKAYERNEITKKNFESQTAALRQQNQQRIEKLKEQNEQMNSQLANVTQELTEREQKLQQTQSSLAQKEQEASKLSQQLSEADAKTKAQIQSLQSKFEQDRAKERAQFEKAMNAQKLSAAQRAAKEAEFRAAAEAKERAMAEKVNQIASKMQATQKELAKAQELANARKQLAERIKQNFAKAGVKASVDPGTGDVTLDFGDQYFDTGRADLKAKMKDVLEKAMPVYSASLFTDPKVAQKIQAVEIVGFASPTYKGRYVDPTSLKPDDKKAVNYNLDLSYSRAKAIFSHVFDTDKMQFQHQKQLLPLVKVTGRSFLAEGKNNRDVAGSAEAELKKAQRVIIKFNLGE